MFPRYHPPAFPRWRRARPHRRRQRLVLVLVAVRRSSHQAHAARRRAAPPRARRPLARRAARRLRPQRPSSSRPTVPSPSSSTSSTCSSRACATRRTPPRARGHPPQGARAAAGLRLRGQVSDRRGPADRRARGVGAAGGRRSGGGVRRRDRCAAAPSNASTCGGSPTSSRRRRSRRRRWRRAAGLRGAAAERATGAEVVALVQEDRLVARSGGRLPVGQAVVGGRRASRGRAACGAEARALRGDGGGVPARDGACVAGAELCRSEGMLLDATLPTADGEGGAAVGLRAAPDLRGGRPR